MVEKKFNFYTIFNSYYKNINKSVPLFLYNYNSKFRKNYRPELDPGYGERMLINYFGVFYIITTNFIIYWDLNILNNINTLKKKKLSSKLNIKKIYFFNIKKYVNTTVYLCTLIK
jgi:hypothetical protein